MPTDDNELAVALTEGGEQSLANLVEQLTRAIDAGEHVDVESLIAAHPEHADRLRELVPTMLAVASWGKAPAITNGNRLTKNDSTLNGVLGDFRILQELGRGGMGTVFEAEQISMGRRVALKVLPFAALVHDKALARFRNEVRAAAALAHPHIVSVYSVGEERSVHFYAMQLIRGQSLADLIWQSRRELGRIAAAERADALTVDTADAPPDASTHAEQGRLSTVVESRRDAQRYRSAARLGIQAAQALQHAHDQGVLHRDIKPGNLLLDGEGQLYVTDFGLARIEADAGMTMTGDIVGTLRYMAPEQALAKRVVIDHRADVYSLGATLYELLTLQPAFGGADRAELLKQIAFEDPKPPRKVDRDIPVDLDTIVIKAMEKNPEDRYATAQALADDLQAYLDDRPIQAKPPTLADRTRKWTRRHVGVAWTMVAATVAVSVALGISMAQVAASRDQAERERAQAEQERGAAIQERNRARQNLYYAEMISGQQHIAIGNPGGLYHDLLKYLPIAGHDDLRGWEWYYLLSQCRTDQTTIHGQASIAWSPDGRYLGTPAMIWNVDISQPHRRLTGRDSDVCAGWTPDGSRFAWTVGEKIYVLRREERQAIHLADFDGRANCLAWHPDGSQIAAGGFDKPVNIYDAQTGALIHSLSLKTVKIRSLDWSPDGKLLALEREWDGIEVWDLETGQSVFQDFSGERRHSATWHPDGKRLATWAAGRFAIFSRETWELVHETKLFGPGTITYSPDGSQIAVTANEIVQIWDEHAEKKFKEFAGHEQEIVSVAWRPDGRQLATASENGIIKIWDLTQASQAAVVPVNADSSKLEWIDDRTLQSVSKSGPSAMVSRRRTSDGKVVNAIELGSPQPITLLPDYSMLMADEDDRRGGDVNNRYSLLSPDERLIGVYDAAIHAIRILDAATGDQYAEMRLDPDHLLLQFAFSRTGQWLVVQTETGPDETHSVETWSIETGRPVWRWRLQLPEGHRGGALPFLHLVWNHADSGFAAVGRGDPMGNAYYEFHLHVFDHDLKRRSAIYPTRTGKKGVARIEWSPSDRWIAMGTYLGYVEVVDAQSLKLVFAEKVHRRRITALRWSPDEQRLCVASRDGNVKIVAAHSGKALLNFTLPDGYAEQVTWSPDGRRIAVLTSDDKALIWDASRGYSLANPKDQRNREHAYLYYDLARRSEGDNRRQALRQFSQLVPDTIATWKTRADVFTELGDFHRAAEEYSKLLHSQALPSFELELNRIFCVLGAGDRPRYDVLAAPMIDAALADPEIEYLGSLAIVASLGSSKSRARDMANLLRETIATDSETGESYLQRPLGACLSRAEAFEEAVDVLTSYVETLQDQRGVDYEMAFTKYLLAVSRWKMGHRSQAQQLLGEANELAITSRHNGNQSAWIRRVILRALRDEAATLIPNAERDESNSAKEPPDALRTPAD